MLPHQPISPKLTVFLKVLYVNALFTIGF